MTKYFNDVLENLRKSHPEQEEKAENKKHYMFLLGTGVNYVHRPDPSPNVAKPRGETFSYLAQVMSSVLNESEMKPESNDGVHAYHSKSVDVINGPDTLGFKVGDRIARALMLALGAVADNKTHLSISGFSRGGVESIMITHELARVKKALQEDLLKPETEHKSLASILFESESVPGVAVFKHPSYTRETLNNLIPNREKVAGDLELKKKLLKNLEKLRVDLFVLDPVPGDDFSSLDCLGWQEKEFYFLPGFVTKKIEFVQEHETSHCFKPIIPAGMPYEVIPGHHGVGDGNQADHNGDAVAGDLTSVQDFILSKWLDFSVETQPLDKDFAMDHPELDPVTKAFFPSDKKQREKLLLEKYDAMLTNYPKFQALAGRNYHYLGSNGPERKVHLAKQGSAGMIDINSDGDGRNFVNKQHFELWVSHELQLDDFNEKKLVYKVSMLTEHLKSLFTNNPKQGESKQEYLSQVSQKNFTSMISPLLNDVTKSYLLTELSDEDLKNCIDTVGEGLNVLDAARNNANSSKLATTFHGLLLDGVTSALIQYQTDLASKTTGLLSDLANTNPDSLKDERKALQYLKSLQEVDQQLMKFHEVQISQLESLCDKKKLINHWANIEAKEVYQEQDYQQCKQNLINDLEAKQKSVLHQAIILLKGMPGALRDRPDEIPETFYNRIHTQANEVNALKEKICLLEKNQEEARVKITELEAFKSQSEQNISREIDKIKTHCISYLKHLEKSDANGIHQLELKKNIVQSLILNIEDENKLPSLRMQEVKDILISDNVKTIEAHRDPLWQRFIRDLPRIVRRLILGSGIYHCLTQEKGSHFFKPSHGAEFINNIRDVDKSLTIS